MFAIVIVDAHFELFLLKWGVESHLSNKLLIEPLFIGEGDGEGLLWWLLFE